MLARGSTTGKPNGMVLFPKESQQSGNNHVPDVLGLVTWTRRISVISEAFRTAMTSILFSGEKGVRPHVLVLTSPSPREGKSTVIANLAIAFSEIGHRVLLIDGDMRLPRLHTIFDMANTWGLSDALFESTPIEEYSAEALVQKTRIPGLSILTSGPARANISRLLYSERLAELVQRVRREFDIVLIDSPPVLSVPDSRILAQASDAVILVLRAGQTSRDSALAAARFFEDDGTSVLGTILNDWNPTRMGHSYYHSNYSSYYYHHGS
jgi:capsular exopolysaccharide synthesis family protein